MTEKNYAPTKIDKKSSKKPKENLVTTPVATSEAKKEAPKEEKVVEEKKKVKAIEKKKEVYVRSNNLPLSTKVSRDICKFIKNKKIELAISDMEKVIKLKKAVPMKGEIPHRKGKMMSGRYPIKAATYFIKSLKTLRGSCVLNDIEEPVIYEAFANMAPRPVGKFGAIRKKRTHIIIKAKTGKK